MRRNRSSIGFVLAATLVLAIHLSAQSVSGPRARAALMGSVYDSLSRQPLAFARVQLVASPRPDTSFMATADSLGNFRMEGVRPGQYIVGFFHELMEAAGILSPVRTVDLPADSTIRPLLAIPSAETIVAALCGSKPGVNDSSGAVIGRVRDAETGEPLGDGHVVIVWLEMVTDSNGPHPERREAPIKTSTHGRYVLCAVPTDGGLTARAEHRGRVTGAIELQVPPGGLLVQDFVVGADTVVVPAFEGPAVHRGVARLTGTVRNKSGRPLSGAQLRVIGTDVSAMAGDSGHFTLVGLPAGTQSLEVRYVGYQRMRVPVELSTRTPRRVAIVMQDRVQELATTTVYGRGQEKSKTDWNGFYLRSKSPFGTFATRAEIEKMAAPSLCVVMAKLGMQMTYGSSGNGKIVGSQGCRIMMHGQEAGKPCNPQIFIDRAPFSGSVADLASEFPVEDVAGIEIYRGPATSPVEFSQGSGKCGVILLWTGRVPK